jgi:hypothetical protein
MAKWASVSVLDGGSDLIRTLAATVSRVKMHLVKNYVASDSYATVVANSLGSFDLVPGDLVQSGAAGAPRVTAVAAKAVPLTASSAQYDAGTATAGAASTLTDTAKAWTVNAYANKSVVITGGTGAGQSRTIASNTATVLTTSTAWTTNPDATSTYAIRDNLHVAIADSTGSAVLLVTDETSDQVVNSGGTFNLPTWNFTAAQPT